jgi:magnesium chelatase subunit H
MGLMPVEATMMVAIPELDGATGSMVFGGRSEISSGEKFDMQPAPERIERLADRVARLVALRHTPVAERKVAIVLFNFPPNSGATGSAAHLSVFESLYNTLTAMRDEGYQVELPGSVTALRQAILDGNAQQYGAEANVHERIPVDDHVRSERWLEEIEAQWGPAPGKEWTDGRHLFVLGKSFGNVMVGIQPPMGYEGDPMRLLFEGGLAPTHAFFGILPVVEGWLRCGRGIALWHTRIAGVYAWETSWLVRGLLARSSYCRFTQRLSLCGQQSVRGVDCQASRSLYADQLFDAAGHAF